MQILVSLSNGKNPAILSLLLLLCHWSHFLCHGRSLGKPKSLSMGMNWNQLRLTIWTKEEKPPGIQYQRILLISALLHLFLLPLPCNLAVTTPVKNWCIIILSQESDISFSIHKKMFLWSILVVLRLLCNALMDLISRCYYWQNEKLITEPKFHQIWISSQRFVGLSLDQM